jgi:serine/threonine-protein kinase RsbW
MPNPHQLTLSAELESLQVFRDLVKTTCQGIQSLDDQAIYDIQLAVDEICTNIILHGYAGMDPGSIILSIDTAEDQLVITITDFGQAFEPAEPPAPDVNAGIEERETGGLGLFFVYMSVDDIQYESTPTGNNTILIKKFQKAA